jgi:hypothetical protein
MRANAMAGGSLNAFLRRRDDGPGTESLLMRAARCRGGEGTSCLVGGSKSSSHAGRFE